MILLDIKEYCWPYYYISAPQVYTVLVILLSIIESNSALQCSCIDTYNSKIYPLIIILYDIKESCWPHLYIFIPQTIVIRFYELTSNITLQYNPRHLKLQNSSYGDHFNEYEG